MAAAEGGVTGILVLPFGLRLDCGIHLAIDDVGSSGPLRLPTCLPVGCIVPLVLDVAAVAALRRGTVLSVSAEAHDGGDALAFPIPLSGFSSALDRITQLDRN